MGRVLAAPATYLLAEANARPGVEGHEDEGVRREVLVQTLVKEAVGVELQGCGER